MYIGFWTIDVWNWINSNEMELNIENCSSNFVLGGVYVRGMVIPSQGTFLDKRKQCYDFKILLHYIITMSLELVNHWAFLFPFFALRILRFALPDHDVIYNI